MPASPALPRFLKLGFAMKANSGEASAAFVNRVAQVAGDTHFMDWAETREPCLGCVVTTKDQEAGFLHALSDKAFWMYDGVSIRPRDVRSIAAYRWPQGTPRPTHPLYHGAGIADSVAKMKLAPDELPEAAIQSPEADVHSPAYGAARFAAIAAIVAKGRALTAGHDEKTAEAAADAAMAEEMAKDPQPPIPPA